MESSWQPSASFEALKQRAQCLALIRDFFNKRHYLEVDTPVMAKFGVTDVYLSNIKATFRNKPYCLQTSPEYHMKRLLAAGSGPIFQLARVFRDDELGRWHNPEFTLLEWYQLGVDHHEMMIEVDALLQLILKCAPLVKKTYQDVFQEHCDVDPLMTDVDALKKMLMRFGLHGVLDDDETDVDVYLFLLMSHVVEPALGRLPYPVAVYDFPASQASLAKVHGDVAARFEVYYQGVELANGFYELTDVALQKQRFDEDNQKRQRQAKPTVFADVFLLEAMRHGLPSCTGVALGVDRLLALALGVGSIAQVMAFDFARA